MGKLLLIKHSLPEIVAAVPSREWVLSAEGRARCRWLAGELTRHGIERLYASLEPKALETASIAGAEAGLIAEGRPDLHENDRTGLGFLPRAVLDARIRDFFTRPDELIIGTETANAARARFAGAVSRLVEVVAGRTTAIVAHGTVITLLVAAHNEIEPFDLWLRLQTPGYVVLDDRLAWTGEAINFEMA
jgi:broad specificity phosphatase PhoE